MAEQPCPSLPWRPPAAGKPRGDDRRNLDPGLHRNVGGRGPRVDRQRSRLNKTETAIARLIVKEVAERLSFLVNVGIGYLSLSRSARTLSGGEAQRIRLATQIGSSLVGVMYVLDEPSIGLHQRDNEKLIATLAAPA